MVDHRIITFLTLCEKMNYRKTAEILNITQPTVTQHIQFLEKKYGIKLFKYDMKTLKITKNGEILKHYAKNIIYQESKFKEQIKSKKIKLSIAATKTIGEYILSNHISNFISDEKNNISVDVNNTESLLKLLDKGNLDFALIEGYFDPTKYAYKKYKKEKFVGICKKDFKFAEKEINIERIFSTHLIIREIGSGTRKIFENHLKYNNHLLKEFNKTTDVGNFSLLLDLVLKTNSISFGYESLLNYNKNLTYFNIKDWNIVHDFNYVFLDNPYSHNLVNYFDSYKKQQYDLNYLLLIF